VTQAHGAPDRYATPNLGLSSICPCPSLNHFGCTSATVSEPFGRVRPLVESTRRVGQRSVRRRRPHLPWAQSAPAPAIALQKPLPRSTTRTSGKKLAHSDDLRFVPSAASRRWDAALIEDYHGPARPTLPRPAETAPRGPSPPPRFCVSCAPRIIRLYNVPPACRKRGSIESPVFSDGGLFGDMPRTAVTLQARIMHDDNNFADRLRGKCD